MHEVRSTSSPPKPPAPARPHVRSRLGFRPVPARFLVLAGICSILLAGCHLPHGAGGDSHRSATAQTAAARPSAATGTNARVSVGPGGGPIANLVSAPEAPSVRTAVREMPVGEIRVIGGGRRFVLIEVAPHSGLPLLSPGLELRSRAPAGASLGGEQTATLRVSPERRQPFIVADVIDGEPHLHDAVFYSAENLTHLLPAAITSPLSAPPSIPPGGLSADPHP